MSEIPTAPVTILRKLKGSILEHIFKFQKHLKIQNIRKPQHVSSFHIQHVRLREPSLHHYGDTFYLM